MNKYQEALCYLVELARDKASTSDLRFIDKLEKDILELIDKQEKYQWHDLRKYGNGLPEDNDYIVCVDNQQNYILGKGSWLFYDDEEECLIMENDDTTMYEPIAWKYVDLFEGEENE